MESRLRTAFVSQAPQLMPPFALALLLPPLSAAAPGAAFAWSLVLAGAVVIASLIPLGAGRSQADFSLADLAAPRAMFERLPAWGKRAQWAHQNCFEAFGLHAPACLLCLLHAPSVTAASPGSPWRPGCTRPCGWPISAPTSPICRPCAASAGSAACSAPRCCIWPASRGCGPCWS